MMILSAALIGYASFWAAFRLMGISRYKSALWALLPALLAGLINLKFLKEAEPFLAALFSVFMFFQMFFLKEKKWIVALVDGLLGLGMCLNGQILISAPELSGYYLLAPGILIYFFSLPLWLKKLTIFPEEFALTKDQKASIKKLLSALIPGPLVYFLWSLLVLWDKELQILPILIFNLVFFLLVCQMLNRILAQMQEHLENLLDRQYQSELLGFMRLIRSQRHDFNFHMQTVYGMIQKEQYEACQDYISSMLSIVQSSNDLLPLAEPAISALLNTFQEMALQKGLKLEVEIHDDLSHLPCSVYEINTILGNLIQNAIDELERNTRSSRIIKLLIIKRGSNNMIKVSNECHMSPEEMKEIFTPGYTTKPSHEGLGLANAAKMAEKYGGVVYPEFEGQIIHMIARIPMNRN